MKKIVLILFVAFISLNTYGQRRNRNMNTIPQTNTEPSEQEIAKRQRQMEERKEEFIGNFLSTLEADDFQKEVIKLSINSFYEAKLTILKTPFERSFDRQQAVKNLEDTHFKDLETLISEADMTKIQTLITGGFDDKEVKKKKKRKKHKKNKDE